MPVCGGRDRVPRRPGRQAHRDRRVGPRPAVRVMIEDAKAGRPQFWESHLLGRRKEYCQIERLANLHLLPRATGFLVSAFPSSWSVRAPAGRGSSPSSKNERVRDSDPSTTAARGCSSGSSAASIPSTSSTPTSPESDRRAEGLEPERWTQRGARLPSGSPPRPTRRDTARAAMPCSRRTDSRSSRATRHSTTRSSTSGTSGLASTS